MTSVSKLDTSTPGALTQAELELSPELCDHVLRYRLALKPRGIRRVTASPDPGLVALHRERFAPEQAMLHAKARPLDLHNRRFDRHDIAEHRRGDEARADLDRRNADEVV